MPNAVLTTARVRSPHRAHLRSLALLTGSCVAALLTTVAPARAASPCTVALFPTTQLGLPPGTEVGYRIDCVFAISGYHVEVGDRIGAPRDREAQAGSPARHSPSFTCTTFSASQTSEFSCNHYTFPPTPPSSTYGTGWWQITRGVGACDAPRMRWGITIYDATGKPGASGPIEINCGRQPPAATPPPQPTQPAALDFSMTRGEVQRYLREMIRDNTNGPLRRLRYNCRRASYRSFRCKLSWRIGRKRFVGRARFLHEGGVDPTTVYWTYAFAGRRRTPGCGSCARRLRWP